LLAEQLRDANNGMAPLKAQISELEFMLAQANAKVQAQEQIDEHLRAYLDKIAATPATSKTDPLSIRL
jgi:hypothetical protein